MATENVTETATETEAPKKRQLSSTFTPDEIKRIDDASWIGRHRKLSDFVHAACVKYADDLLASEK